MKGGGRARWPRRTARGLLTRGPFPAKLPAAQQQSVPVGKRTALEVQKKVWPPEGQYKANLPFTRLGRESARPEGGNECATTSASIGQIRRMRLGR